MTEIYEIVVYVIGGSMIFVSFIILVVALLVAFFGDID